MPSKPAPEPSRKIQPRIPSYQAFVIDRLRGIYGTNESDIVVRIIGEWIALKEDWLNDHGMSIENWRGSPELRKRKRIIPIEKAVSIQSDNKADELQDRA